MVFPPKIVDMSSTYKQGTADNGWGNPCNQMVIHFTVSGSRYPVARNLVGSVQRGEAGGATQCYIDDSEVVLTGPARLRYWATGSALGHNDTTYNIEICGAPASQTDENGPDDSWLDINTPAGQAFKNAAWWAAQKCKEFEIEPRLLTIGETAGPNVPGITTHYRISMADGVGGSDHTDWDDSEPIVEFVNLVRQFYYGTERKTTASTQSAPVDNEKENEMISGDKLVELLQSVRWDNGKSSMLDRFLVIYRNATLLPQIASDLKAIRTKLGA